MILAGSGVTLSFDYSFVEGAGNDDEFGAFVLDSTGFSAGFAFEFFTQDTSSGTVSFDLSLLVSQPFIGLQFQLSAFDFAFDSTVAISNVQLTAPTPPAGIPEPSALLIFGVGLLEICRIAWRKRRRIQLDKL